MGVPEYKAKASAKVYTRYHIVLVTKYRRPALASIEQDTLDSIRQAEQHSRFTIHEANTGDGNHIHLLVSIPPDQTISGTVQRIKQLTARPMDATRKPSQTLLLGQTSQTMVGRILLHDRRGNQ